MLIELHAKEKISICRNPLRSYGFTEVDKLIPTYLMDKNLCIIL